MKSLLQDLRYGSRLLHRHLGFTIVAVIALALGIGASTAVFSVVNGVLLTPLPYNNPDRLVMVWESNKSRELYRNVVSPSNFLDWRERNKVFEQMAAFYNEQYNLTDVDIPEELPAQRATVNLFSLLGVNAVLGRTFIPNEGEPGQGNVAILSYGLWQRRFGSEPNIIGKTILLNGRSYIVVGVMPPGFQLMIRDRNQVNRQAELWVPLPSTTSDRTRRGRFLSSIARLKDGVTIQQAQADMSGIAGRLEEEYPDFNKGWGVSLISLKDQMVGELQPTLLVLLGAVSFVLLIACANITNLLLVRAALRQGEFAIRAALGANHWRIIRQLLIESVLLASLGGLAGLLLARWGVGLLLALAPEGVLGLDAIGIDFRLLGFTLLATLITSIIFGLAPALESTRINLSDPLKGANKGRNTKGSHRLRNTFVVVEVALAFILLIGAGLMVKSFLRLQAVNPGFEASNLLTARLALPTSKYSQSQRIAFFKTLLQRVRALPGVRSVGAISHLPFSGSGAGTWFTIVGRPAPAAGEKPSADVRVIDPSYFAAMGIPIPHGRNFSEKEASEPSHVVIINETMARQYWPNEDPIGQKVVIEMSDQPVPSEIIGVVGDVKHKGLSDKTNPMVYWPHPELPFPLLTLVIRTDSSPLNLSAALRSEVLAVDRDQPIADLRTMEQLLSNSIGRQRLGTLLIGIFAVVAVILASVGVYGLIAQSVTERTQEIGIRIALGAQTRDVLKLIIGHGLKLVLCGVAIGLIGAFALTRFLTTILYTVSTTDYTTFLLISLLLFAIALIASYVPARRAIKVDPVIALRYE